MELNNDADGDFVEKMNNGFTIEEAMERITEREAPPPEKVETHEIEEKPQELPPPADFLGDPSLDERGKAFVARQQNFQRRYAAIDWSHIREYKPDEYAALRHDFDDEKDLLEQEGRFLAGKWEIKQNEKSKQQELQAERHYSNERQALMRAIPGWENELTRQADQMVMADYLKTHGADDKFISAIIENPVNHVLSKIVWDAAKYHREHRGSELRSKPVFKIPKKQPQTGQMRQLEQKFMNSRDVKDAAALLNARLKNTGTDPWQPR